MRECSFCSFSVAERGRCSREATCSTSEIAATCPRGGLSPPFFSKSGGNQHFCSFIHPLFAWMQISAIRHWSVGSQTGETDWEVEGWMLRDDIITLEVNIKYQILALATTHTLMTNFGSVGFRKRLRQVLLL